MWHVRTEATGPRALFVNINLFRLRSRRYRSLTVIYAIAHTHGVRVCLRVWRACSVLLRTSILYLFAARRFGALKTSEENK